MGTVPFDGTRPNPPSFELLWARSTLKVVSRPPTRSATRTGLQRPGPRASDSSRENGTRDGADSLGGKKRPLSVLASKSYRWFRVRSFNYGRALRKYCGGGKEGPVPEKDWVFRIPARTRDVATPTYLE